MNVPLDKLYSFLSDISNHCVIIYRFFPHGSKNLSDLGYINDDFDLIPSVPNAKNGDIIVKHICTPTMICHDQEPLLYDLYQGNNLKSFVKNRLSSNKRDVFRHSTFTIKEKIEFYNTLNTLNIRAGIVVPWNIYDQILLCHSEKNSQELELFESNGCVGVYWWSHAFIALDWYRYAKTDCKLKFNPKLIQKDFLVYNRAWKGTREYRLKFAELVVDNNLQKTCQMKFQPMEAGQHYKNHTFKNIQFQTHKDLESYFELNSSSSSASADYSSSDYQKCAIEIVLETMFDDQRLHLTEKTLRPIACGKPFIVVSTRGALRYLKDYGFKTFESLIDESYDDIEDPYQRLQAVIRLMKHISSMPQDEKEILWTKMNDIALYNKKHFFGQDFTEIVVNEYKQNLRSGLEILQKNKSGFFYQWYKNIHESCHASMINGHEWQCADAVLYHKI